MSDKFVKVKQEVKSKGLTVEHVISVLEIIEFAEDNDVELYLEKGKLRMKSTVLPKKNSDIDTSGIFDLFGDLFKKK